MTYAKRNITF